MVPLVHPSQPPNGISIDSAVFAGLTNVTDRQTDYATPSVATGRILWSVVVDSCEIESKSETESKELESKSKFKSCWS